MARLDVIVPTWNNANQFNSMVNSLTRIKFFEKDYRLIAINNGKQPIDKEFAHIVKTGKMVVVNCEENRGWEGGLIEGLKISTSEYVCFQNDDVHIPQASSDFYETLMDTLLGDVALAGPITTCAAGTQSIYSANTCSDPTEVRWIIFFCAMAKRAAVDAVGGIDDTLPGGDDLDLSIRIRKAGKKIMVNPKAFLIHHGFQTGERVKGGPDVEGGWNSRKMMERTNKALIQKHRFRTFHETVAYQIV